MDPALRQAVESALGQAPVAATPLSGGCVAEVFAVTLASGEKVVVKRDPRGASGLEAEARSLALLGERGLPVPAALHAGATLLVLQWVDGPDPIDASCEQHAAQLLAELHDRAQAGDEPRFGLDFDTYLGGIRLDNRWMDDWPSFFAQRRLLPMAELAARRGRLPRDLRRRVEQLAQRLDELLEHPVKPSLIHGDVWAGNVLCRQGRVAAFIDPAPSWSCAEAELAFITLFSTFGRRFFDVYAQRRPLDEAFFRLRRHAYNTHPLLTHVALFGGGYVAQLDATLRRIGF